MNTVKKLSVIVPVYNVDATLERCVLSIEDQDLPHDDYEVILVNDGSTDNSLRVADSLAMRFSNIRVFNKENGGQSSARNVGMDMAVGEYYMFVDSDDYLYPGCLAKLMDKCRGMNLDVLHFPLSVESPTGECSRSFPDLIREDEVYSGEEWLLSGGVIGSACSDIIRASLVNDRKLRFTLGIVHEDTEFTTRLFCYVRRLAFIDIDVYHYSFNPKSSTRDVDMKKVGKNLFDSAVVTALSKEFATTHGDISPACKDAVLRYANTGLTGILIAALRTPRFPFAMMRGFLQHARQLGVYPVSGQFLNRRTKWTSWLLNHEHLYLLMYKLFKKHA